MQSDSNKVSLDTGAGPQSWRWGSLQSAPCCGPQGRRQCPNLPSTSLGTASPQSPGEPECVHYVGSESPTDIVPPGSLEDIPFVGHGAGVVMAMPWPQGPGGG